MAAEKINFRSDKVKHIKKDEKMSERDRLKEKMKRMKPDFRNMLRT
jgi:predicted HicB family RNase H-like nuclease